MKKLLLILVLLASVRLEAQFVTTFAKNATESQMEGVLYYLPRNVIRLEFTIEEIDYACDILQETIPKLRKYTRH